MSGQSWGYRFEVEPVEFVTFQYVYKYLHISSKALKASHILDGIPFRVRSTGRKEFRLTEIKRRLAKFNLYPPDTMHPLHKFQAVDAAREMGVRKIDTYFKRIKEGKITLSTDEQGRRFVYRKDMDKFRRRWMPKSLVEHMLDPLPRRQAAIVLGWSVDYCKAMERSGEIAPMPRKKRELVRYSKAELLRILRNRKENYMRRKPLPEYLEASVAALYAGLGDRQFYSLRKHKIIRPEEIVLPNGKKKTMYSLEALDRLVDRENGIRFYCEGVPYYTRSAIRYKFLKSERWIDQFVLGTCRRMRNSKDIVPPEPDGKPYRGWVKEDVEKVVAEGHEVVLPVRGKSNGNLRVGPGKPSEPYVDPEFDTFDSPLEQMEAALHAAMDEKAEERAARAREHIRKRKMEAKRRAAFRNQINYVTGESEPAKVSKADTLKYSDRREIVTIMTVTHRFTRDTRYTSQPNAGDELVFSSETTSSYAGKVIRSTFAGAIAGTVKQVMNLEKRNTPSWIIVTSGLSMISDPMFHEKLERVSPDIAAVGAHGYGYILPDGSWDSCPDTYGSYSVYDSKGNSRKVLGTGGLDGVHRVQVLDGPFVAVRGEYLEEIREIEFFRPVGDYRGFIGPCLSALFRRFGMPMAQIPVDCWCPAEQVHLPGTPEWATAMEYIERFEGTKQLDKIREASENRG